MPWVVSVDGRCTPSKPWAVVKQQDGSIVACHATKAGAIAQQKALYANEPARNEMVMTEDRAQWSASYINDLPDSAFLYIAPGGEKDDEGKTTPRDLRYFPYRDAGGAIDLPHLRNALARIPQSDLSDSLKADVTATAQRLLDEASRAQVPEREVRTAVDTWPTADLELRAEGDGMTFEGYAAVFDSPSEPMPWVETIAPGAFTRTLKRDRDIRMFLNHNEDILLATTKAKTLTLAEDDKGLLVRAQLPDTTAGRDLSALVRRGDVASMSFAFADQTKDGWSEDGTKRTISQLRLFEVSPITGWPAYGATSASVRGLADALKAEVSELEAAIRKLHDSEFLTTTEVELLAEAVRLLTPTPVGTPNLETWRRHFARKGLPV